MQIANIKYYSLHLAPNSFFDGVNLQLFIYQMNKLIFLYN